MSTRTNALSAYRNAVRAIDLAFKGDARIQTAARVKLRTSMREEVSSEHPEMNTDQRIDLLNQVATYLRRNVVQGVKKQGEDRYVLRIHKDTELGDNKDTKKRRKPTMGAGDVQGGCCGQGQIELKQKQ